jgi:hypothetical protein
MIVAMVYVHLHEQHFVDRVGKKFMQVGWVVGKLCIQKKKLEFPKNYTFCVSEKEWIVFGPSKWLVAWIGGYYKYFREQS